MNIALLLLIALPPLIAHVERPIHDPAFLKNYLNHTGLLGKVEMARTLRVYIGRYFEDYRNYEDHIVSEDALFPGVPLNLSRCHLPADLYLVKDWLHVHAEYSADAATFLHLKHAFNVVATAKEADICFGSCDEEDEIRPEFTNQAPAFVVPKHAGKSLFRCEAMSFGIENESRRNVSGGCQVPMPYVSSIHPPNPSALAPWDLKTKRDTLLVFYGGVWRGGDWIRRRETIEEMEAYSDLHKDNLLPHISTYFKAPMKMTAKEKKETYVDTFFVEAWDNYAHSIFSWQPRGDSPTRRAFYDSWLFGCIPVISEDGADMYQKLFRGAVFNWENIPLDQIAVVLPHAVVTNGTAVMEHLSKISVEEIRHRRNRLRAIAPIMSWGWETKDHIDPLLLFFALLMN